MRKKTTAVMAVIVVLIMLLVGTFAWIRNDQHKTNEANGDGIKYDVALVEEFNEEEYYKAITDWKVSDRPKQHEIRVKNTGLNNGAYGDVFVRLQLKEFMELMELDYKYTDHRYMINTNGEFFKATGTNAAEAETKLYTQLISDPDMNLDPATAAAYAARAVQPITDSDVKKGGLEDNKVDYTWWYIPTQAKDINGQYGKYLLTDIESVNSRSLIPDVVKATATELATYHSATPGELATLGNLECLYTVHQWHEGTPGECLPSARPAAQDFHQYVQWGLNTGSIMSLNAWAAGGQTPTNKWIYDSDSAEGWVYWGMPLSPDETTDNLINTISLLRQPSENFYYAIHVDMQAVSLNEIDTEWGTGATTVPNADVLALIEALKEPVVTNITLSSSDSLNSTTDADGITTYTMALSLAANATKDIDFSAYVQGYNNPTQEVIWSIDEALATGKTAADSKITAYGKLTVSATETGTLTVRATSTEGGEVTSVSVVITITRP